MLLGPACDAQLAVIARGGRQEADEPLRADVQHDEVALTRMPGRMRA